MSTSTIDLPHDPFDRITTGVELDADASDGQLNTTTASRFATALRWLGTFTVAGSAIFFLLQGLGEVEGILRNWGFLALMGLLTLSGVATRAITEDAKSVRLLLTLAAALIPIQFAQIAGMLHALISTETSALTSFFAYDAVSWGHFALAAVATSIAFLPVAFLGFSVLLRPDARVLTTAYLLPTALLLVPLRLGVPGFALIAVLGALTLLIDRRLHSRDLRYRTREGFAVRGMLMLPLVIAGARYAFHVDTLSGGCALFGLVGLALVYAARNYVEAKGTRGLLTAMGGLISACAWITWASNSVNPDHALLVLGPVAAFSFALGTDTGGSRFYRVIASALMAFTIVDLLAGGVPGTNMLAFVLGLATATWGVMRREKDPAIVGSISSAIAFLVMGADIVDAIRLDHWFAMALGGVALVVAAAFVERYGARLTGHARKGWSEVSDWR